VLRETKQSWLENFPLDGELLRCHIRWVNSAVYFSYNRTFRKLAVLPSSGKTQKISNQFFKFTVCCLRLALDGTVIADMWQHCRYVATLQIRRFSSNTSELLNALLLAFKFLYSLTVCSQLNDLRRFQRSSGVPRNFVRGGGSTNSVEDRGQRERGIWGRLPLVRGSGGSCNLVQEMSFHIVKFS